MITVSLDEQGDFEDLKQDERAPIFIGGVIYDDKGDAYDTDNEKNRIVEYLKKVCQTVGRGFPEDMHCRNLPGGGTNSSSVRLVKQELNRTLSEFIRLGTYDGTPVFHHARKGEYCIFAMLKSDAGKRALLNSNVSVLTKDDVASNLYVHMAEDIITRLVFHNPVIDDISLVKPDLATRRIVLAGEHLAKAYEYERLGYRPDVQYSSDTEKVYQLTNPDNYRTALAREMLDTEHSDIQIERMGVKSIYYGGDVATWKRMAFLYIADIICSVLGYEVEGTSAAEWLQCFHSRITNLTGANKHLLFGYDSVDTYYKKAWEKLEDKDYYKALSIAYEGTKLDSEFADFYAKEWFPKLKKRLLDEADVSAYRVAIKKFSEAIHNNNLESDKLIYIYESLVQMSESMRFTGLYDEADMYDLYDAGISVYCHIGDSMRAENTFALCKKYVAVVGVEKYLRTLNKMVVFCTDSLQYEKALELAMENVSNQEFLIDIKKEILGDESFNASLGYAIALSQLGQSQAFCEMSEAVGTFEQALSYMEKGSPDYYITMSYMLHDFIAKGDREGYEQYAPEYFGDNTNLKKQLTYLVNQGMVSKGARFDMGYAMYVYTKALYTFYVDEISEELVGTLSDIKGFLEDKGKSAVAKLSSGHPWELVYKYLAFIMVKRGSRDAAEEYMAKTDAMAGDNQGELIRKILECGYREYGALVETCEKNVEIAEAVETGLVYMYR